LLGFALSITSSVAAREETTVSDCMDFGQVVVDGGMEYRLINHCEKRVSCNVTWTLSCGDQPPFQQFKNSAQSVLAPEGERSLSATARACKGESWEISNVIWACSPQ
jgi:hypothetical protein